MIAPNLRQLNAQKMIKQLRVDSVEVAAFFKEWGEERARLGLPQDFDQLLPRKNIRPGCDWGRYDGHRKLPTLRPPGKLCPTG